MNSGKSQALQKKSKVRAKIVKKKALKYSNLGEIVVRNNALIRYSDVDNAFNYKKPFRTPASDIFKKLPERDAKSLKSKFSWEIIPNNFAANSPILMHP